MLNVALPTWLVTRAESSRWKRQCSFQRYAPRMHLRRGAPAALAQGAFGFGQAPQLGEVQRMAPGERIAPDTGLLSRRRGRPGRVGAGVAAPAGGPSAAGRAPTVCWRGWEKRPKTPRAQAPSIGYGYGQLGYGRRPSDPRMHPASCFRPTSSALSRAAP
jgi:hypothetical protein